MYKNRVDQVALDAIVYASLLGINDTLSLSYFLQ